MATATGQPPPLTERRLHALRQQYRLEQSEPWRLFLLHTGFCESFGFFVLLAPELAAVELARRTLHDHVTATGGQWHHFFITPATAAGDLYRWLLSLPALPPGSAVWVSASIDFTGGDPGGLLTTIWRPQASILNTQRDALRAHVSCPVIFAGPDGLDLVLRENAPDLWSVRETTVHLTPAPADGATASLSHSFIEADSSSFPEDQGDPALTLSEAAKLKDNPSQQYLRAELLRRAGQQLTARQRWPEAEAALKEAWAILEKHQALPETLAKTAGGLAVLYREWGQYQSASAWMHRYVDLITAHYPGESEHALIALNSLAILMAKQGNLTAAAPLFRRLLEARERTLGPEHPHTLTSLNNLALLLNNQGDTAGAEPLYRRALAAQERSLGPEHPDTLRSLHNLACLLANRGDLAEAETLFRRALQGREKVLGPEHSETLGSLNSLAGLLMNQGDLGEAQPLFRRTLEVRERVLGPEHPDTLRSLHSLAILLNNKGDSAGAEPLYLRALEAMARTLGPEHPDTLVSLHNLGVLREEQGRLDEAEALYTRAVAGAQKVLLPGHPERKRYEQNLARVREQLRAK